VTKPTAIKFGAIGVRGESREIQEALLAPVTTATIAYALEEEAAAIRWMHGEVTRNAEIPLLEAEAVVRSLTVAMHGDQQMLLPLLQLRQFDEYTTTHSLNVSVLTMALAEHLGELLPRHVRVHTLVLVRDHDVDAVRVVPDVLVDPVQLDLQLLGREADRAEHAEAACLADGDDDVAAVGEGEDRELDAEVVAHPVYYPVQGMLLAKFLRRNKHQEAFRFQVPLYG
jgi:hypothetical protein